ncbi:MAG: methionine adenosyltransferase domain-containing protein [Verrucomicrobiota bacterium]
MKTTVTQFAEYVSPGHPDRLADAVAERIVEFAQSLAAPGTACRNLVGVEVAIHDSTVFIDGRIALEDESPPIEAIPLPRVPFDTIVQEVFAEAGYDTHWRPDPNSLEILVRVCEEELSLQEADIRPFSDDQNIVIGYACDCAATNYLPPAHYLALTLGRRLNAVLRRDPDLAATFGPDFKILCTCRTSQGAGGARFEWERLTLSAQHCRGAGLEEQHRLLTPIIGELLKTLEGEGLENVARGFEPSRHLVLNGAGDFVIGGPRGDNGLSGKKLVVDHYGPGVPIGGGALCGKDPYKVDRCGALRARQLARNLVRDTNAQEAKVTLSWSPGEDVPGMRLAELVENGNSRIVAASSLPGPGWFSIRSIVDDLNLVRQNWAAVMRAGYFAERSHTWEA